MNDRIHRRIAAARELALRMRVNGDPFEAQVILDLCRSASSSNATNKVLYRDNIKLREDAQRHRLLLLKARGLMADIVVGEGVHPTDAALFHVEITDAGIGGE